MPTNLLLIYNKYCACVAAAAGKKPVYAQHNPTTIYEYHNKNEFPWVKQNYTFLYAHYYGKRNIIFRKIIFNAQPAYCNTSAQCTQWRDCIVHQSIIVPSPYIHLNQRKIA